MALRRPLVPLAAGVVGGAALAHAFDPGWAAALLALPVLVGRRHPALALAFLGLGTGALRQELAERRDPAPLRDVVEGVVDGPPRITRALSEPEESTGSFIVDGVQVRFYRMSIPLVGGETVRVKGAARRPRPPGNPGQFDYAAWLRRRGVDAVMTLRSPEDLEVLRRPSAWHRGAAWLRALFDRGPRPEVGAFLSSIVLGRREPIDDELMARFQRTGTAHLLAISGQNLLIVLAALWALLLLLGVHGRAQTAILLLLLGLYVPLTGFQVSVTRAYLMIAAFLGADLLWRRRDPLASLSAAALLIVLGDPGEVADPGFQLSFAAVLGLSHLAPALGAAAGPGGALWDRLRMTLAASTAAWLATAPVVLEHFNLFTPAIVPSNLALVPLLSGLYVVGLLHLPLAAAGLGGLSGAAANLLFDGVDLVSRGLSALPLAYAYGPGPGAGLLAAYGLGLAAWARWSRGLRSVALRLALLLPLVGLLGLGGVVRRRVPDVPRLSVLDVGRGSCAVLEKPDGRVFVFDCGSLDYKDPASAVAAPFLWRRGITRIHALVLSHPDQDHVNGAPALIERFRPSRVLTTRAFDGFGRAVERRGAPERVDGLEILGPPPPEKLGTSPSRNDGSLIVRVDGVLLPGDIEDLGVEELLTLPDLRARVLVLPHHGKFFKRHEELYRRVAPDLVVASAPPGYGSPRVLEASPVPPLLTGIEGAVEIELRAEGLARTRTE